MWCIPRKGTAMSDAVRNILQRKEQAHRDNVTLPIDRFVEEHTRLIETLKTKDPELLKKEAERQAKELNEALRPKRKSKPKRSQTINLD